MHHPRSTVDGVASLECSSRLASTSPHLPALAAGAYSFFSRKQLAEALIDAWIVSEQLLDFLWEDYLGTIPDSKRKDRLADTKTYSAGVRTEVLYTVGRLPHGLYAALNESRKHRNELVHRAKITLEVAQKTVSAMTSFIEHFCGKAVAHAEASSGVNW